MKRILLAVAFAVTLLAVARAAEPDDTDALADTVVFVGRLLALEELPDPCEGDEDCISMDSLWRARYEVVQPISGRFDEREIRFDIADHYGFPPFARYQHALLFVARSGDNRWLHKYQGVAMHRTADGQWASCGEIAYRDAGEPPSPHLKPLRFAREIAGMGELSEAGWRETLREWRTSRDSLDLRIEGDKIWCTRGIALPDVYETMRNGALRARGVSLPAWQEL